MNFLIDIRIACYQCYQENLLIKKQQFLQPKRKLVYNYKAQAIQREN